MLSLDNVSCGYGGGFVVNNVSFSLAKGERICVLGPNGSGKTTLIKAAAGLLDYAGSVILNGGEVKRLPRKSIAKKIAVVTQTHGFYFPYTVFEVAAFGRYAWKQGLFGGLTAHDREHVFNALNAVGMYGLRNRLVSALSGGQFQKVFLAKAFAQNPDIMLLDEPLNHLDIKSQYEFMEHLDTWAGQKNEQKTIVAVLHDINFALAHFNNALLMNNGRAAFLGSTQQLKDDATLAQVFGVDVKGKMLSSLNNWCAGGI